MTHPDWSHDQAASYLHGRGFSILDKGWVHRDNHLCIVAAEGHTLVIAQIVLGEHNRYGVPLREMPKPRIEYLRNLARLWMVAHADRRHNLVRIDRIGIMPASGGITIEHVAEVRAK